MFCAETVFIVLTLLNVLHALLCTSPRVTDVLCFVQFTAATLAPTVEDEKVSIEELSEKMQEFEDFVQSVDVAAMNKI